MQIDGRVVSMTVEDAEENYVFFCNRMIYQFFLFFYESLYIGQKNLYSCKGSLEKWFLNIINGHFETKLNMITPNYFNKNFIYYIFIIVFIQKKVLIINLNENHDQPLIVLEETIDRGGHCRE